MVLLVDHILSQYHAPCLAKVTLDDPDGAASMKACREPVDEQWDNAESTKPELTGQKETALDEAVRKKELEHVDW